MDKENDNMTKIKLMLMNKNNYITYSGLDNVIASTC